jgi:hypothetical protein
VDINVTFDVSSAIAPLAISSRMFMGIFALIVPFSNASASCNGLTLFFSSFVKNSSRSILQYGNSQTVLKSFSTFTDEAFSGIIALLSTICV